MTGTLAHATATISSWNDTAQKPRTLTLLTAHRWRNSIGVRMRTGGGMGARYGETGRALICQAAVHQWSVNGTHKPWGLGPDTLHPLSGCRHSPGPRHGGGLRAKATGRVNDAWPEGHTHTPAWCLPLCVAPSDGKILFGILLMWPVLSFGFCCNVSGCAHWVRGIRETAKKKRGERKFRILQINCSVLYGKRKTKTCKKRTQTG